MSVIGGVALFAAGLMVGGSAVWYNNNCVRKVEDWAGREMDGLKDRVTSERFEKECDRAYRRGFRDGRRAPQTDAERFAETFEGRRVEFRDTSKGA